MSTSIRQATSADAAAALRLLGQGLGTYRSFAPEGWEPPLPDQGAQIAMERFLDHPDVWYAVAEDERGHAAQCGFTPAHERPAMQGARIPGLAHFWQLFVREDLWGTGLAGDLHSMAVGEMRDRGYERARLATPAGQARSRAFYERRGWRVAPMSLPQDAKLGLELVEYRLDLRPSA